MKRHKNNRIIFSSRSIVAGLLGLLILSSCAVINPYVQPDKNEFQNTRTFDNAVKYAEDTREAYIDGISSYSALNRGVGAALIGTAAAALGLGIGSGSASTISMMGLGGAGLFGLNSWLNGKPKQQAYQAGLEALNCTLAAYVPVQGFQTKYLDENLAKLDNALRQLDAKLKSARETQYSSTTVQEANEVISFASLVQANGRSALDKGQKTKVKIARAGIELYEATQNIRAQVIKALTDTEGNAAELVASLSKIIPVNAGLITGKPYVKPQDNQKASFDYPELYSLKKIAEETDSLTNIIEEVIVGFATPIQPESCSHINPAEAGISFKTNPDSNVVLDSTKTGQSTQIIVSGGVEPYTARWITIPTDLKLSLNHDIGKDNEAAVLIEVLADAKPGNYELNIVDKSRRGNKTLLVSVVGAQDINKGKPPKTVSTNKETQSNPLRKNVQDLLISLNCLPSTINGKPSNDGILGAQTKKAIEDYFTANNITTEKQKQPFLGDNGLQSLLQILQLPENQKCSSK